MFPLKRTIGLILLLGGFVAAYFGITGLFIASFLWVIGTAIFAHSFLK
ncbi:hypothetical protein ACFSQZ_04940 [Rubritalea spongiae]|uniref:Phosphatidate cytidylyltransferase n=1 Tax=Rubritalea spongiae TaxID=430797 RepID=A0ABW5E2D5_9BACT